MTQNSSYTFNVRLVFIGEDAELRCRVGNDLLRCLDQKPIFKGESQHIVRSIFTLTEGNNFKVNFDIIDCPIITYGFGEKYIDNIIRPLNKILEENGITAFILVTDDNTNITFYTKMTAYRLFGYLIPKNLLDRCVVLGTKIPADKNDLYNRFSNYCKGMNEILTDIYGSNDNNENNDLVKFKVYPYDVEQNDAIKNFMLNELLERIIKEYNTYKYGRIKSLEDEPHKIDEYVVGTRFIEACTSFKLQEIKKIEEATKISNIIAEEKAIYRKSYI